MNEDIFNDEFYERFGGSSETEAVRNIDNRTAHMICTTAAKEWIDKDLTIEKIGLEIVHDLTYFKIGEKFFSFPNKLLIDASKDLLLILDNKGIGFLKEFLIAFDSGNFTKVNQVYGVLNSITGVRRTMDDVETVRDLSDKFLGKFITYMNEENFHHAVELFIHVLRKGAEYEKLDF